MCLVLTTVCIFDKKAQNKPLGWTEPKWLIGKRMANPGHSYPSANTMTPMIGLVICFLTQKYNINQREICQDLLECVRKENLLLKNDIIFVKWFRHWRTGKRVYPKNGKVIAIRIRKKPKPDIA